jgi:ABC-2 type transport system ATP-binding protein
MFETTSAEPVIRCQGLTKRYSAEVLAVDGLDLEVLRGECFGLLGPNGAGKTTTIEVLEGLLEPTGGLVEVLGRSWARDAGAIRARLGITLQETHLPDRLKVFELIELFRSFYPRRREVDEILALVSLGEKRASLYEALSGGQKQRLAVACALVGDPQLLFLDEPTTGLDPQSRRQLWEVIGQMKAEGRTVLLTTHYMDEAERLCDRVAVIDRGRVIALGSPRELIDREVGQNVLEFATASGELATTDLERLPGVSLARQQQSGWALSSDSLHATIPALLELLRSKQLDLARMSTRSATLEDVFLRLTGRKLRD